MNICRVAGCLIILAVIACSPVVAINLKCSSIKTEKVNEVGDVLTCHVSNIQITQKDATIESDHLGSSIDLVKGLWIDRQTVHYIPKFAASFAQRLELLRIGASHLKSINQKDLHQFPNLRYLEVYSNDFVTLDDDLFGSTPKLEFINFNDNKLKSVGHYILQPISLLKSAHFYGGCITMSATTPAQIADFKTKLMTSCEKPETIIITTENNPLEKLEKENSELTKENLQLKDKISELEKQIPDYTRISQKFESCNVNLDTATRFLAPLLPQDKSSFAGEKTVELVCKEPSNGEEACEAVKLIVSDTKTIFGSAKDTKAVTSLIIRDQAALFLPTNLNKTSPDLKLFEISSSGLFVIDHASFEGLLQLETLNLTGNKILSVTGGSFEDLQKLQTLDLSLNNIESIETEAFSGLDVLKFLLLNDNILKKIATKFLSPLKMLEVLDLSRNSCVDSKYPETALKTIEATVTDNCSVPISFTCESSKDLHVCRVENLQVDQPKTKIQKIVAQNFDSITELVIEDQDVKFLPQQLAKTFPKLQKLVVSRSNLT